ncbi:hypothetical protein ACTFIY_003430 [Dictyostelium cf. discoideum]
MEDSNTNKIDNCLMVLSNNNNSDGSGNSNNGSDDSNVSVLNEGERRYLMSMGEQNLKVTELTERVDELVKVNEVLTLKVREDSRNEDSSLEKQLEKYVVNEVLLQEKLIRAEASTSCKTHLETIRELENQLKEMKDELSRKVWREKESTFLDEEAGSKTHANKTGIPPTEKVEDELDRASTIDVTKGKTGRTIMDQEIKKLRETLKAHGPVKFFKDLEYTFQLHEVTTLSNKIRLIKMKILDHCDYVNTIEDNMSLEQVQEVSARKITVDGAGILNYISTFEANYKTVYSGMDLHSLIEKFTFFLPSVIKIELKKKINEAKEERGVLEATNFGNWIAVTRDMAIEKERINQEELTRMRTLELTDSNNNNNQFNNLFKNKFNNKTKTQFKIEVPNLETLVKMLQEVKVASSPEQKTIETTTNVNSTPSSVKESVSIAKLDTNLLHEVNQLIDQLQINALDFTGSHNQREKYGMRIKGERWVTALIYTGCSHSVIHPSLIDKTIKITDCNTIVTSTIETTKVNCNKLVSYNVNLNSKYYNELKFNWKFHVIEKSNHNVIGLDFLGSSEISFDKAVIVKRFKDSSDRVLSYRVLIPIYEYGYGGDKFKPTQIISCLETTKLKLSLKEKLDLKGLIVGVQEKLDINKKLEARKNNNSTAGKISNNNSDAGKISNNNSDAGKIKNNDSTTIIQSPLEEIEVERIEYERNLIKEKFSDIIVDEIPETMITIRSEFDMDIKIKNGSKPVKRNTGRRSPEEFKAMTNEATRLLNLGIIEESVSDYSSIPFLAKNKGGKSKFVIDYRAVNYQTVDFAFPIPNADDTLERTKKAKWFSKVYCKSGFHLLNLNDSELVTSYTSSRDARHVLTSGIKVRDSKVDAILKMPEPATVKQVRAFIGSYQEDTREDIYKLKVALTSAPLLMKPNHDKPFKVYIDVSNNGTGVMITQVNSDKEEQPILYDSKKFNKFQRNYNTTDKEFLALTNVLNKYEYLLVDKQFEIFTDHLNLTYYQKMKDPPKRLVRALDLISKFKFTITHIPGEKNIVADMLSRDASFALDWDDKSIQEIKNSYKSLTGKDKIWFETLVTREDVMEKDGMWYFIDPTTDSNRIILVDKDQIKMVLDEAHSTNYSGHLGRLGMKLRCSFIWAKFWDRINNFVMSCIECQKGKLEQEKHGLLNPLPIPSKPWDDITMDFLSLPMTENGFDQVFVVVDRLSKMVKIIPCKKTITAAEIFWKKIVCVFGLPLSIVSDNDKLFTSELWVNLMKEAKVKLKTTAPARPQADGQTERTYRAIINMLSKMTNNRLRWDEEIANIELAINTAITSSTKLTPASIVNGFELRLPYNEAQIQQAVQYNKTREDIEYTVCDLVLVKRSKLNTIKLDVSDQLKLLPNYCGPFSIVEKKSDVNYIVHVDDIKPFIEEDRELFNRNSKQTSIPLEDEIDKVIEKRNRTYGTGSRIEYLIRFKNQNEDHDKWVPQYYLESYGKLIEEFEKELAKTNPVDNNFKKKYL